MRFVTVLILSCVVIVILLWRTRPGDTEGGPTDPRNDVVHVGTAVCATCHADEHSAWVGSHHDKAMAEATSATVLGDFDSATLTKDGVTSTFMRRGDKFVIRTDGPDGKLTDFDVHYTFGVEPLQQYLVELPGGRLQVPSLCFDTRPKEQGGQRWFHLYGDERIDHTDELHWTRRSQNWNHMCAECHSTDLRKNYDAKTDSYTTTWAEIDVACEACHGPGSRHVDWARESGGSTSHNDAAATSSNLDHFGFPVSLRGNGPGTWEFQPNGNVARKTQRPSPEQVETCARCHSRRGVATSDYHHGHRLADTHLPRNLDDPLYFADGQIRDEVYVWGSFVQSKMHAEGVVCTDCHDPHSARLKTTGNGLCYQCHRPEKYDVVEHHHHPKGGDGAQCVDCHMPARHYMVVDSRRDHGFHIPRPDLTMTLGTPNACNGCHRDRTAAWAANEVARWSGGKVTARSHFATALHAGREGTPGADAKLLRLILDDEQPAIARATAYSLIARRTAPRAIAAARRGLVDVDPLVRRAAITALETVDPPRRLELVAPLLDDPIRTVRTEAGRVLAPFPASTLDADLVRRRDAAVDEYVALLNVNADRAGAHVQLGLLDVGRGRLDAALSSYRTALRLEPDHEPAVANLADLHRERGEDMQAIELLEDVLERRPTAAALRHALGLAYVRLGRRDEGLRELRRAADDGPNDPHLAYVYGVALNSTGEGDEAIAYLETALLRHPNDEELLFALATMCRDRRRFDDAVKFARRLVALDSAASGLLEELERARRQ